MVKVALTNSDDIDVERDMTEAELRIILEFKPEIYIDGNDYKFDGYQYDAENGKFRIYITKD